MTQLAFTRGVVVRAGKAGAAISAFLFAGVLDQLGFVGLMLTCAVVSALGGVITALCVSDSLLHRQKALQL